MDFDFIENASDDLTKYSVFWGHNWYYTLEILPSDIKPCAFLREPLERSLSAYEHILRDPNHHDHERMTATCESPEGISNDDLLSKRFSNAQTRALGRQCDFAKILDEYRAGRYKKGTAMAVLQENRLAPATRAELEIAKKRLQTITFGITEKFDESCHYMARRLDLRIKQIPRLNAAPPHGLSRKERYSAGDYKAMRKLNDLDIELYEYARRLWK